MPLFQETSVMKGKHPSRNDIRRRSTSAHRSTGLPQISALRHVPRRKRKATCLRPQFQVKPPSTMTLPRYFRSAEFYKKTLPKRAIAVTGRQRSDIPFFENSEQVSTARTALSDCSRNKDTSGRQGWHAREKRLSCFRNKADAYLISPSVASRIHLSPIHISGKNEALVTLENATSLATLEKAITITSPCLAI